MRAAIYIRVSSEDQVQGYSLDGQKDECIKYLLKKGYDQYEVYADDGYSAKDLNRPALQRLLRDINNKKIKFIVFWALDRLSRDPIDGLILCRETFYKNGVDFASILEELDISSADGELMLTIRLAMARAERRRISERVKLGYMKRAKSGKRNSPARPFGYNVIEDLKLTVKEEEVPYLKMIFEWYLEGKGIHKIVRELNQMHVSSPRGRRTWNRTTIMSILKNPTYIGYNHWKLKEVSEDQRILQKGDHPPLISDEKFELVQELIRRRSKKELSRSSYNFYFSTILKCAICGYPMYGNAFDNRGKTQIQYYCQGKRLGFCTVSTVSERKITRLVLSEIKSYLSANRNISKEVFVEMNDVSKETKRIEKEIGLKKVELEKLVSLYLADKIDMDIYEKKRDHLKGRLQELENEKETLKEPTNTNTLTQEAAIKLLENLQENWDYMSDPERKWLIQSLYNNIKVRKVNNVWRIEEMTLAIK